MLHQQLHSKPQSTRTCSQNVKHTNLVFGRWEQGTTVTALREKLQKEDGKRVVCWSNGNVFRSVTLLAVTWCEEERCRKGISNDADFDIAEALTKENLATFMSMLKFGKVRGYLHRTTIMDDRLGSSFELL